MNHQSNQQHTSEHHHERMNEFMNEWIDEFYYSNILSEATLLYDKWKLILTNMLCKWLHEISIKLDGSDYMGKVIAYNHFLFNFSLFKIRPLSVTVSLSLPLREALSWPLSRSFFLLCMAKGVFSPVPPYSGYFVTSHFIVIMFVYLVSSY